MELFEDNSPPEREFAEQFIERLTGDKNSAVTYQTFDDCKQPGHEKRPELAKIYHGSLDEYYETLKRLNNQGAGIYITVNETDLKGREIKNIVRTRAVWSDDDHSVIDPVKTPIRPHMLTQTSPGKQQVLFCTEDGPLVEHAGVLDRMVQDWGCDPGAKGLNRVLRLPGFYHMKNPDDPFMVEIIYMTDDLPYSWEEIKRAFPPIHKNKQSWTETQEPRFHCNGTVDVATVLDRALKSRRADDIRRMLEGDRLGHHPSDSERDLALCNSLVFFCGRVPDDVVLRVVDEIVRSHAVHREKWDVIHRPADGASYGQMTIEKAINNTTDRYMTSTQYRLHKTESAIPTMERIDLTREDVVRIARDEQKGCAELFIKIFDGRYCYDHAAKQWYRYGGHCWMLEDIGATIKDVNDVQQIFKRVLAEISGDIVLFGEEMKRENLGSAGKDEIETKIKILKAQEKVVNATDRKLNNLTFRKNVVEFAAQGHNSLGITGAEWDQRPWELACYNGVIDLKTGLLRPGRPEDYIKSPAPTEYDPEAQCPRFCQALLEIFDGDRELVDFLQMALGMGLIGDATYKQILLIWYGEHGRNGKDTIFAAITHTLGVGLVSPIRREMLMTNNGGKAQGPTEEIMALRGKRIVVASETNEGMRFDAAIVKQLTGGGDICGRHHHGRETTFTQTHAMILMTNRRPHVPVDDNALWQRIRTIPFNLSFVENPEESYHRPEDKGLKDKLREESKGILRWMVEGCLAYQRAGMKLGKPEIVKVATEEYRRSEDTLGDFIEENCFSHHDAQCRARQLFNRYRDWCVQSALKPMSEKAFATHMERRGFRKDRNRHGVFYAGLGIVTHESV